MKAQNKKAAKASLKRIQERIKPFSVEHRFASEISTGKWYEATMVKTATQFDTRETQRDPEH